jgi:hypothetical protein
LKGVKFLFICDVRIAIDNHINNDIDKGIDTD